MTTGYELSVSKELPELVEQEGFGNRGGYSSRGNASGRGRGGYFNGGSRYQNGGRSQSQARSGRRVDGCSIHIGGLAYTADETHLEEFCKGAGLDFSGVRVLRDESGQSRGTAFVDFYNKEDAE